MFVDTSLTTSFSAINYQLCNHKNRDRIRTILTSPTLKKTTAFNFFLNIVFMLSECCFSSVQFSCSVVSDSATPWTAALQASLSITSSRSLLKLMCIESVTPSSHLILCRPLLLPSSIFPSIRVFSNESVLPIWWPKYWSFNFSISPSDEHPGLIFFRMDCLDLLADQGTLKSLLQHHSSKVSSF